LLLEAGNRAPPENVVVLAEHMAYQGLMVLPAEYWLAQAADARALADEMDDADAKSVMLMIIAGYEQLAAHAAAMGKPPTPE
jgi:hypothetical protein